MYVVPYTSMMYFDENVASYVTVDRAAREETFIAILESKVHTYQWLQYSPSLDDFAAFPKLCPQVLPKDLSCSS